MNGWTDYKNFKMEENMCEAMHFLFIAMLDANSKK